MAVVCGFADGDRLGNAVAFDTAADAIGFDADALYAYWGIIGTHLLFVALAFAILHYGRTTREALGLSLGVLLLNDIVDYGVGFHPPLRYEPGLVVPAATVALSFVAVALAAWGFDRLASVDNAD